MFFEWNRRDTLGLNICNKLSKLLRLKLKKKNFFLQKELCNYTELILPFSKVEMFHLLPFAEHSLYRKTHISYLIIHPASQKRKIQQLVKFFRNKKFKGILLIQRKQECF